MVLEGADRTADLVLRYVLAVPLGLIGLVATWRRERFAYDLWGDTVNLASRLEANGEPGRILVSEATYERLPHGYRFSGPCTVDLKGKGPTTARFLMGRSDVPGP